MNDDLGKFIKNTKKICPDCERFLELRRYGEKEKLICPRCDYEEFVQVKRVRRPKEEEETIVEPRRISRPITRRSQ